LLVLLSGSGRTLENLLGVIERGELDAEVVGVGASRECLGAQKARARGIETRVFEGGIGGDELDAMVEQTGADWVVLAGYLKLVPITDRVRGRVVNIHPALLPGFGGKGMHGQRVHEAVIEAFRRGEVRESGCTVHFADDAFDTGGIIAQKRCVIEESDTPETLAARVFELECECYPEALRALIEKSATP
jgi:phosphoribosylglycinamide formyltransferase-1